MALLNNNHLTHFQSIYTNENKSQRVVHLILDQKCPKEIVTSLVNFNTKTLNFSIETYFLDESQEESLISICQDLFKSSDLLLVIGNFRAHKALFDAYQLTSKSFGMVCLLSAFNNSTKAAHFLQLAKPYLKVLQLLGNQIHLSDEDLLKEQSNLGLKISLGQLNLNLEQVEPLIRSAELCTLDMAALANHQIQNAHPNHPSTGFTTQQLAQCMYYSGRAPFMKILGIDISEFDAVSNYQLMATMVWYFIYGLNFQQNLSTAHMDEFVISSGTSLLQEMSFYKDQGNQQWWLENPAKPTDIRWRYIPCDYQQYSKAASGEIDDHLLRLIDLFQTL